MSYQRKLRIYDTTDSASKEERNTEASWKKHTTSFFRNISTKGNITITAILTPLNASLSGKGLSVHVEEKSSVVKNPSTKKGIKSKPSINHLAAPTSIKNLTAYVEEEKAGEIIMRTSEIQLSGNKSAYAPTTSEAGAPLRPDESTAEMQEVEVSNKDNDEEGTDTIDFTAQAIENATEKEEVLIRIKMNSDPLSFSQNSEENQVTTVDLVDEDNEKEIPVETKGSPSKEKKTSIEPEGGNITTVSNDYDSFNTNDGTKQEDKEYVDEENEVGGGEEEGQDNEKRKEGTGEENEYELQIEQESSRFGGPNKLVNESFSKRNDTSVLKSPKNKGEVDEAFEVEKVMEVYKEQQMIDDEKMSFAKEHEVYAETKVRDKQNNLNDEAGANAIDKKSYWTSVANGEIVENKTQADVYDDRIYTSVPKIEDTAELERDDNTGKIEQSLKDKNYHNGDYDSSVAWNIALYQSPYPTEGLPIDVATSGTEFHGTKEDAPSSDETILSIADSGDESDYVDFGTGGSFYAFFALVTVLIAVLAWIRARRQRHRNDYQYAHGSRLQQNTYIFGNKRS